MQENNPTMSARILLLMLCFVAASAYIARASKSEPVFTREPLSGFPLQIGKWAGRDVSLDDRVVSVLGVDDYVSRDYVSKTSTMGLYIGFYQSQRQGNTIHSPLNCLPGAGWNPVARSYISIPVASDGFPNDGFRINRIVIEKGLDRAVVLYWYQAHGRVVANEYWGKFYAVLDAMRINRTDGAMVRVVSPIPGPGQQAEAASESEATSFVQSIFPLLSRYLPE
jgi:EpsI family protein